MIIDSPTTLVPLGITVGFFSDIRKIFNIINDGQKSLIIAANEPDVLNGLRI